jgi:hypothetical protein
MHETTARRRISVGTGPPGPAVAPTKVRAHKPVCATCLRPLDIWPDGTVLHKDARFDLAFFPEHHTATELP